MNLSQNTENLKLIADIHLLEIAIQLFIRAKSAQIFQACLKPLLRNTGMDAPNLATM